MNSWEIPVPPSELMSVMNWLVQHIKNIDFQYVGQLPHYVKQTPIGWDDSLEVFYARLDEEHIGLFDAIKEVGMHPDSTKDLADLKGKMRAHFDYERGIFCDSKTYHDCEGHSAKHDRFFKQLFAVTNPVSAETVHWAANWLVQHIRNTDFKYKHKLVHEVPEPYVWNESFMTFYKRIDDEHKGLFDCIADVADHPDDAAKAKDCQNLLRRHFDYEESEFCAVHNYDCHGHYLKHYNFQMKFQGAPIPVPAEITDFAKNWLAQHIKNTDFAYRGKLHLRRHYVVPEPYIWEDSFAVGYQQMDDEHVGLFDIVREVEEARDSQEAWDHMYKVYDDHFVAEE